MEGKRTGMQQDSEIDMSEFVNNDLSYFLF